MRKWIVIWAVAITLLTLACCGRKSPVATSPGVQPTAPQTTQSPQSTPHQPTGDHPTQSQPADDKPIGEVRVDDLIGPWHLEESQNDMSQISETLIGSMEFGSRMELMGDGKLMWYIGIEGGSGTFLLEGNLLHAELTDDVSGAVFQTDIAVTDKEDAVLLTMQHKGVTLIWSQGEGQSGNESGNMGE
nr:hypothetical protein [bacterium]